MDGPYAGSDTQHPTGLHMIDGSGHGGHWHNSVQSGISEPQDTRPYEVVSEWAGVTLTARIVR